MPQRLPSPRQMRRVPRIPRQRHTPAPALLRAQAKPAEAPLQQLSPPSGLSSRQSAATRDPRLHFHGLRRPVPRVRILGPEIVRLSQEAGCPILAQLYRARVGTQALTRLQQNPAPTPIFITNWGVILNEAVWGPRTKARGVSVVKDLLWPFSTYLNRKTGAAKPRYAQSH